MGSMKWRLLNTGIAGLAILTGSVLTTSCSQVTRDETRVFRYSEELGRAVLDNGGFVLPNNGGKIITLDVKVTSVKVQQLSPSIVSETSVANFAIVGTARVPNAPGCTVIQLLYDDNGLLEPRKFQVGDLWEIRLTEKGELYNLWPK